MLHLRRLATLQSARPRIVEGATKQKQRKISMSTEAKTAVAVIVKTSPKVIAAIVAQLSAEVTALGKQAETGRTIRTEAKRMGYDKDQAREMATLCWREAKAFKSKDEQQIKDFDLRARPDVSKAMAIAFPVDTHKADTDRALAHNEKIGTKHGRISSSKVLDIARGKLTFDEALAGKSATAGNGKTPTPAKPEVLTLTTLENELAGIRSKYCKPGILTPAAIREVAEAVFCDGTYSPTKTKTEDKKAK